MTLCPRAWWPDGVFVLPVPDGVRVRVPSERVYLMRPPSLAPSLVARAGGGQEHHAVHGREAGEVEAGLVQLGDERSRRATVS